MRQSIIFKNEILKLFYKKLLEKKEVLTFDKYGGQNCNIKAVSIIGGSVIIGGKRWISPSFSIRDAIKIDSNSLIGMGSVVIKSVSDNEIWVGNPAISLNI